MYRGSQMFLVWSVLLTGYCALVGLIMLTALSPVFPLALVGGVIVMIVRGRRPNLWIFGTGRFSTEKELRQAGLAGAEEGLILGWGPVEPQWQRIRALLRINEKGVKPKEACRRFFQGLRAKQKGALIRLANSTHIAIIGPTGAGKGVSCVIPFLLTCTDSVIVLDYKGELAEATALHRKRMGQTVIFLDPYGKVAKTSATFNALEFIDKDAPNALEYCWGLAKAMVVRTQEEKEPHWNDAAELWIATMIAVTVQFADEGFRNLQTVRNALTNPQAMKVAIEMAQKSDAWGGMLSRLGHQVAQFTGEELGSVKTTVNRHLRAFDTPSLAANIKESSFNPDFRTGMTIYLIPSVEHARTLAPWLRLNLTALINSVVRGGLQEKNKVHLILDEMATLGRMEVIEDVLDKYRAFGLRCQMYFQSIGQISKCFPGQEQTVLSNTTQVFFGVNDSGSHDGRGTAEYLSNRIGDETVMNESWGSNYGDSQNSSTGSGCSQGRGTSRGESTNSAQTARKVLTTDEVLNLPARTAITFAPGVRPIMTTLLRYYEEPWMTNPESKMQSRLAAFGMLMKSAAYLGGLIVAAWCLTEIASQMHAVQRIDYHLYTLTKGR